MFGTKNYLQKAYDLKETISKLEKELKETWKMIDSENITEFGGYKLLVKEDKVRKIDIDKFREHFGMDIFFKCVSIPVGKAENELGKNRLTDEAEKGRYLSYQTRKEKMIIKE